MIRLPLLGVLAVVLVSGMVLASGQGERRARIFPYEARSETLDNGLKVVLVPMASEGLVAYWTIVRTGSRDEYEPGKTGFAHFFEHMMFRGTERFPADLYNEQVSRLGADSNAFTTDDLTGYYLDVASVHLEKVMDLESDRFQNLSYAEEAFRTEAGAVYGEYRKGRVNPFFVLYEALREAQFDVHTYGHTTMGYERDIRAMPELYEYSKEFFKRYYRPENVVLLVVGDFEPDRVLELARRHYGGWEPGYVAPDVPVEPAQGEPRRIDVEYSGRTLPIVWTSYKTDRFDPSDRVLLAADLLCELAFGETSELYRRLVLEERVVEFLSAGMDLHRDPGPVDIYARVKESDQVERVLSEIETTLAGYREDLPDPERLAALKSRLRYGFLMGLDTPSRVARSLVRLLAVTGDLESLETMYATYDAVRPEDIRTAARKYFVDGRRTTAVLRGRQ